MNRLFAEGANQTEKLNNILKILRTIRPKIYTKEKYNKEGARSSVNNNWTSYEQ